MNWHVLGKEKRSSCSLFEVVRCCKKAKIKVDIGANILTWWFELVLLLTLEPANVKDERNDRIKLVKTLVIKKHLTCLGWIGFKYVLQKTITCYRALQVCAPEEAFPRK